MTHPNFILAVGLFQVTYLIACFSIVSAPEAVRISEKADVMLAELRAKVAIAEAVRNAFDRLAKAKRA